MILIARLISRAHDSAMQRRPLSRGYSILAALVFVAILGSITAAVNLLSPSANPIAMTSLAGNAGVKESDLKTTVNPDIEAKCKEAIQAAIKNAGRSPQLEQPFTENTVEQNKCVGAQADDVKVAYLMESQKKARYEALLDEKAYSCYGESTRVYMNKAGKGTIISTVNKDVVKGKCAVTFCDEFGISCGGHEVVKDGGSQIKDWAARDKAVLKQMSLDQLEGIKSMGLDKSQQDIFKQAYEERKNEVGDEVLKQAENVKTAEQRLEGLARSCGETPGEVHCAAETKKAQQALDEEKKKLTELKGRLDALNKAEKSVLTPPREVTPIKNPPAPPPDPRKPGSTFPDPKDESGAGKGGDPLGMLGGLLQGLMKGLGGAGSGSGQGNQCAADPAVYQQQQQQYQMQLQQYNMQLQQYNYQQRQAYDFGGYLQEPPPPPAGCTPNPNANTCPAAPAQPTTGCTNGSWRPVTTQQSNGRQCTTSWQCAPSTATPPTAELSCQPKVADVGMSVAISFSCANATGSSGSGFSTGDQTSGSTTTVIATPPQGATGITYALTCRNQNLTARAECAVEIARPTIVLLANPKNVVSGESSRIGWITSGMQSCVVSSPQMPGFTTQNANNKSVNGVATTSPITRDTTVVLTCATIGGSTKVASTIITVGNSTSTSSMNVSSTIDGNTDVRHGATTTITWSTPSAPANSAVALWLVDVQSGQAVSLIERSLATSGTFTWTLPAIGSPCAADSPYTCGADLMSGKSYVVQASLYTPPDAYLGGFPPANPVTPTYLDEDFTAPAFKMGD